MSSPVAAKDVFSEEDADFESILKHVRSSVPSKSALIKKERVEYINGTKLVDGLMSSKWAQSETPYFETRDDVIKYCQKLLEKQLIVGGQMIQMQRTKKEDEEEDEYEQDTKKKVRRFRVDWLHVKKFNDSKDDIYIWRYEPPNRYRYMIGIVVSMFGLIIFLGVIIAFTLQPLWPESSKYGMWYVSVLFMVLLAVLLLVYVVRWFVWGLLFTLSVGKINLWLLPNLDNDRLGVIESFKPLYSLKFKKKKKSKKEQSKQHDTHNGVDDHDKKD